MEKITKSSKSILIDPNEPLILPDGTALVGRIEWFLYALCCLDYQNLPTPMSRIEEFANALITGEIPNIQPQSRAEQFFLAILDGNVSNLPQPQSRSEVLLDKLARGEFDLSDVEPIQSHYELLLAYLIKNGGIGNIDYVLYEFSEAMKTMYNTVEKPFKSLELSGNTLVNCVLENTENDDYTSFDEDYSGTSFTINGTSEGAIKSAILSGQTLVNLVDFSKNYSMSCNSNDSSIYTINEVNNSSINITQSALNTSWRYIYTNINLSLLKANTKYLIVGDNMSNISSVRISSGDGANTLAGSSTIINNKYAILTTNDLSTLNNGQILYMSISNITTYPSTISISNVRMLEYVEGMENWDIPYFEGMQSVKMPVLTTTGKNLWRTDFIVGKRINTEGNVTTGSNYACIEEYIKILPKTSYVISNSITGNGVQIFEYDSNKNLLNASWAGTGKITTQAKTEYFRYSAILGGGNNSTEEALRLFQFEQGTVATSYEPYKSNILTVNEDVTLRGIGEVQDELDGLTGQMIERVGETVLNGSEIWWMMDEENTTNKRFRADFISKKNDNDKTILCEELLSVPNVEWGVDREQIEADGYTISIRKAFDTVEDFKTWLSQNPLTVQYQLAQESVKTVDLNVVDQNNTKIDKIHVFDEITHVNASSDELTPTVNIGKSVSYPTIIKPNTEYTVDLKRNDKPLTVNLGGTEVTFASGETRKTITTPSTLTNDKLSYYGVGAKCNEIMLIEGEVERNVDYFTGMQSVVMQNQMPILHTVGENLFDISNASYGYITSTGEATTGKNNVKSAYIPIKPNTKYSINAVGSKVENSNFSWYDSNKNFIVRHQVTKTSISPDNAKYLIIHNNYGGAENIEDLTSVTLMLTEGDIAEYKPYKSSILSCNDDDVTLRRIGDVQDMLDCLTGEVTERIEEIVLDGGDDEEWVIYGGGSDTHQRFVLKRGNRTKPILNVNENKFLCDKFKTVKNITGKNSQEMCLMEGYDNWYASIIIDSTKLNSVTVDGFKSWLQSNNVRMQYVVENESFKSIDLNVVDQDGNTIPKIKSYNDVTHLEVTVPKQSLLPNVSAEVATDNSKDMSSLITKHQEISEAQLTIQNSIQSQTDEIDTAMMATTEIFESILE